MRSDWTEVPQNRATGGDPNPGVPPGAPDITSPRESLLELSARYARAADGNDAAAFCALFEPDGVLRVAQTATGSPPVRAFRGHSELITVTEGLVRYDRTYHMLGQALYDVAEDRATGEVYCVAHHFTVEDNEARDRVLYIRYLDNYRRGRDGWWRFTERELHIDCTETRTVDHVAR